MFSLAFLEIKSLTKISDTKSSKDWKIGFSVIATVLASYLCIYIVLFSGNSSLDDSQADKSKQQFLVGIYNQFLTMPDPFAEITNAKS